MYSCRKIKPTTTNGDMSYENMLRLQTERFERHVSTFIANEKIQTVSDKIVVPVLTTTKDHNFGNGCRCSVKNCLNRYSKNFSFFGYPSDFKLRKKWIKLCGLQVDPNEKVKVKQRVCRTHFDNDCFTNTQRKNRLRHGAIPTLFLDNAPNALPVPVMNAMPESRTYCTMPGCTTNTSEKVEDISFFTPQNEEYVIEWTLSACLDFTINSIVCEKHFRSEDIVLLPNGLKSLAAFALPVRVMSIRDKSDIPLCSIPGCITNNPDNWETEDICLFAPQTETVNKWSSILGLQLTEGSQVCEKHFRPHHLLQPTIMNKQGARQKIKSLVPFSLPLPMNDGLSASNVTPFIQQLETNDVPVLRTYGVKFKRHKPDEMLCTKTINKSVLDKSLSTTDKMFPSKNKNKEFTAVTNDTQEYNITPDLDPTLKSNTTLGMEQVEDDDLLPLSSFDYSLSITLQKLKNISANSSLSITFEQVENSKITEPSVDLLSKVSPKSSMSITLLPKHNLSSSTNNRSPYISLPHCLSSTSSISVYNVSQQSLQYKQKATSTLKMPDKLSSNNVEINMPVISKCNSLAVQSDTHDSNPCTVINYDDTEDFIEKDNGFIYEIAKSVVLPTTSWRSVHDRSRNSTVFFEENNLYETVKNIRFDNSLLPKIQIKGKKYKYNKPVRTKNELQNLLNKIECIEKCIGFDLVIHDNCIGYYDKTIGNVTLCSACQEKFQELHKMEESQT